jgi:hypothetical protein
VGIKDSTPSFYEKKEAKRLLIPCSALVVKRSAGNESFFVIFFKEERS